MQYTKIGTCVKSIAIGCGVIENGGCLTQQTGGS